jgi:hypothetical protein
LRKPEDDIDRADFKLGVEEVQDFDENGNLKVPGKEFLLLKFFFFF